MMLLVYSNLVPEFAATGRKVFIRENTLFYGVITLSALPGRCSPDGCSSVFYTLEGFKHRSWLRRGNPDKHRAGGYAERNVGEKRQEGLNG